MDHWRDLLLTHDAARAGLFGTALAAMEFEVRVRDQSTGLLITDAIDVCTGPFVVEVLAADWPDLIELRDEIIDEQTQFDEEAAASDSRRRGIGWGLLAATMLGGAGLVIARAFGRG